MTAHQYVLPTEISAPIIKEVFCSFEGQPIHTHMRKHNARSTLICAVIMEIVKNVCELEFI